jgi:superfamily I DNA/RNA helicase
MAVTFTNKAARAMENRVLALLAGSGKLDGLTIGTFAICAHFAQRPTYQLLARVVIFDTDDQLQVMKQAVRLNLDPKKPTARMLHRFPPPRMS